MIVDEGKEIEAITRLSRVGFDNCLGYLDGGFLSWKNSGNKIETISNISPLDFTSIKDEVFTLDVRKSETFIPESSIKIPLSILESKIDHLDTNDNIYVHCAGGYRSMIAASILKRNGFNQIIDIIKVFQNSKMFNQFMKQITFLLVFFLFSCNNIYNSYKEARFSDFYNSNSNKLLIDVRTPEEFIERELLSQLILIFITKTLMMIFLKFQKKMIFIYTVDWKKE